jgi:hypothetical protein
MTKSETLEINLPTMMIGFKLQSLIKALSPEQKIIYKNSIEDCKRTFLSESAKHLPEDKVSQFLLLLECD